MWEVREIDKLLTVTPRLTRQCQQGRWLGSFCDKGLDAGRFAGNVKREGKDVRTSHDLSISYM
jgi:hypothetical protein